MIPDALQPAALLAQPQALASHLRTLLDADQSLENLTLINTCILDQVHTEAIPPFVYKIWLQLTCQYTWQFTVSALRDPSHSVRAAAIYVARRRLFRGSVWKERGWDLLGGAQGIKDILDDLPLAEVKWLVKVIFGRCGAGGPSDWDRESVSVCVEEFLALVENTDRWTSRSLMPHVSFLYAYCRAEKVDQLLRSQSPLSSAILGYLPRFHMPLLRRIAIGAVAMPENVRRDILERCRRSLLSSKEAYEPIYYQDQPSAISGFPGLVFGMDLVIAMEKEPEQYSRYEYGQWVKAILQQVIRKLLPFELVLAIFNRALPTLQPPARAQFRKSSRWLSWDFYKDVVQFWSIARFGQAKDAYGDVIATFIKRRRTKPLSVHLGPLEKCLIQHLLQKKDDRLDVHQRSRDTFFRTIGQLVSYVDLKGRLEFLHLLCRHSPSLGFDLTAWPPSQREQELVPVWDFKFLKYSLRPEHSKLLFSRSLHIHRCEDFLPAGEPRSGIPSWEEQCFFWAEWESSEPEETGFRVTRKALDDMKLKSMRGRQPHERLQWAKSVVKLADTAGNLDFFAEILEWSKRYIRDALVFRDLLGVITTSCCGHMLSCRTALKGETTSVLELKSCLLREAQIGHKILEDLLQTCLLLLREPWAQSSMAKMTAGIKGMLSSVVGNRMNAVRKWSQPCDERASIPETEAVEILLEPLLPILLRYEREGNTKGQTSVKWTGPSGLLVLSSCLPDDPNPGELSFVDRLAKARDEVWQQLRAETDPSVLDLGLGWPRGLAIQHLVSSPDWLGHVMRRPHHAPFLSSRANEVLYSTIGIIMVEVSKSKDRAGEFVDDLKFIIRALLTNDDKEAKRRDILGVWEYYSKLLHPHPAYLELFRDWLVDRIPYWEVETTNIIRPPILPVRPRVSPVPAGSGPENTQWNPCESDYLVSETASGDQQQMSDKIPCTMLNCRMVGEIPSDALFVRRSKPQAIPEPLSIWSPNLCLPPRDNRDSRCVQEPILLAALLFLDTHCKSPGILGRKFPDVDYPRYPPVYLTDEFIAFHTKSTPYETLVPPIEVLRRSARRVPPRLLRDLIWSFLDTLKAEPNAPMYSTVLFRTFDLIETLLVTDKPQLAVDVVLRVWTDFPHESSFHRRVSLAKLGRTLTRNQARDMMWRLTEYVCDALKQAQHSQGPQQKTEGNNRPFVKVTTAKMLAQALAEANFLAQCDQMAMLQRLFDSARHIDIRREAVAALLELVSNSDSPEPYKVFASIASSVAGPNEREMSTEAEWEAAEKEGPLPYVGPVSERPILDLVVSTAAHKIPEDMRVGYVQSVLLPLLKESTRQHTRWMAAMSSRLGPGLPLGDRDLVDHRIGPFAPDLPDEILQKWANYLPCSYLWQYHRPWALPRLQHESLVLIDKALAVTTDVALKEINVQDHWQAFLNHFRSRPSLHRLDFLLARFADKGSKAPQGLQTSLILEEFIVRAEAIARHPLKWSKSRKEYIVCPDYTLVPLRLLRKSRVDCVNALANHHDKVAVFDRISDAMKRVVEICEAVRKEARPVNGYPVTLPPSFEYDILQLPSPIFYPTPPAYEANPPSAAEAFTEHLIDFIIWPWSSDPIFLLKLNDCLEPVLREIPAADLKKCILRLGMAGAASSEGRKWDDKGAVSSVMVKLARSLLGRLFSGSGSGSNSTRMDSEILAMIEGWKRSDLEFVRQVAWEWEWPSK
ncbi:uncharacterized protein DSM5745_04354 [Aspergillus mulundensis]|uniref:Uncharacterized protein n=1 Tax=Aspergillus mulundensis TaxID=1810919 RepID=A0A3D8SE45_9EURO|nr:hypothetical protein DSM5745_04354 [Aspergillus mulundensis]RDW84028.1 hypothetical protein DSM5745_04354 [Aspergillus mulundensis]